MKIFGTKLENKKYVERIGAYGIFIKDGLVAVIQHPQGYFLPGGGVDEGESFEDALKREGREELGWEIDDIKPLCTAKQYYYSVFHDTHFENIGNFFTIGKAIEGQHVSEPDHVLVWLTPQKAAEKLYHEHQRWAVLQCIAV